MDPFSTGVEEISVSLFMVSVLRQGGAGAVFTFMYVWYGRVRDQAPDLW